MKKILLLFLLTFILIFTACASEQAEIPTSPSNAESTPPTNSPENTAATVTAVTDNAQELEWRSDWKSKYDKVMADWQPAQLFSTKEYTYGIDELSISQNDDGSCTVSFFFGAAFNLYPGDYRMDDFRLSSYPYYPELYLEKDAEQELTLEHWSSANSGTINGIVGPYLSYYEFHCDEKPQALYFKTPEFRVIDMHAELVVDDPLLYTVEFGKTVSLYDRNTHTTRVFTPVNFVLDESLGWTWKQAKLYVNDTEIGAVVQRRDGIDYFIFNLPESTSLDSGYTFVLSREYVDLPRQVFEIDITGGIS